MPRTCCDGGEVRLYGKMSILYTDTGNMSIFFWDWKKTSGGTSAARDTGERDSLPRQVVLDHILRAIEQDLGTGKYQEYNQAKIKPAEQRQAGRSIANTIRRAGGASRNMRWGAAGMPCGSSQRVSASRMTVGVATFFLSRRPRPRRPGPGHVGAPPPPGHAKKPPQPL